MPDDGARVDAGDLSVVIPYRADVPARRENLAAVLRHLDLTCGRLEILLIEDGPTPDGANLPRVAGLRHFGRHNTGFFHRTRLLNEGVETLATRRFAASFDTDALLYPQALAAGLERLRAGAGLVYPFDGRFINLRGAARPRLLRDGALPEATTLPAQRRRWWHRPAEIVCVNEASVGGVVLFERAAFMRCGGYHEGFRAWGFEDAEIRARMLTLGTPEARVSGWPLLHLDHPRKRRNGEWYESRRKNHALYRKMAGLERAEIEALIASGALRDGGQEPTKLARMPGLPA
jgi:hypothetical protein